MIANLSAVALFAVAWWIRGTADAQPGVIQLVLEAIGLALLGGGAYMGGTLVTRNLIGVDHRYAQTGSGETRACMRGEVQLSSLRSGTSSK
jgi:hypothetical protein